MSVLSGSVTIFVDYVPGSGPSQVGISKGPPPSSPPPPAGTIGNGTCGATSYGNDCNTAPKGAWHPKDLNISSLADCAAHAEGCKMAAFVSYSDVPGNEDCSWYSECDFARLCEDCSKCGIGCPKYYPYQSEVIRAPTTLGTTAASASASSPASASAPASASTPAATHTAGRKPAVDASHTAGRKASLGADFLDKLQLLPTDAEITLRVFVDVGVIEAYWMDGRVAMTIATQGLKPVANTPQAEAYTTAAGVELASAKAYTMGSIWVTPEQVLATPRRDQQSG